MSTIVADKFASIAQEHLDIVLAPGMLDRAAYNTSNKELSAWQLQLETVYRTYIDRDYDDRCPYCFQNMVRYFRRKRDSKYNKEAALRKQAEKFGATDRREILSLGLIDTAVAQVTDQAMYYLAVAWIKYINPHFRADCDSCLSFVLKEYRLMKPFFEDLQKGENLLNLIP